MGLHGMDLTLTYAHDKRKMLDVLSCVLYTVEIHATPNRVGNAEPKVVSYIPP